MRIIKKIVVLSIVIQLATTVQAQEKWDLLKCVTYARANNISVKQQDVQARISQLTYQQSKLLVIPTANYTTSGGYQYGRSIDPTTNQFTNNQIGFINMNLESGITLFNWFSVRNNIAANKYATAADKAMVNKLQDDVSLNVAAAYLQALQSVEQQGIATVTVGQTKEQLATTRKKVNAGSLPELNAAELEAQLATDSASLVTIISTTELNLLQLKALLALDAAVPFDIATPSVEQIPLLPLAELEPNLVFNQAVTRQPQQIADNFRMLAAHKNTAVARANMYPTLSGFAGLQTGYSSATSYLPKSGGIATPITYPIGSVNVGGTAYQVLGTSSIPSVENALLFRQFDFNFRQNLGFSISVPLFNNGQAKTVWHKAQLNEEYVRLQSQQDTLTLKQNIYQAYQNALASMQTFWARQKAVKSSEYAYQLGKKRYDIGFLAIFELLTLQNNAARDKINLLASQFDYVFKMKILEFYKGGGLKL